MVLNIRICTKCSVICLILRKGTNINAVFVAGKDWFLNIKFSTNTTLTFTSNWKFRIYYYSDALLYFRSNCLEVFYKQSVLKKFTKFTGKHLCRSPSFNKVAGLRPWCRCFSVNFAKYLRTLFSIKHLRCGFFVAVSSDAHHHSKKWLPKNGTG